MKNVGIIGSGMVGVALAKGFLKYNYHTTIASRNADRRRDLALELDDGVYTDTPQNTAKNCDILVFAVKALQAKDALKAIGVENLKGKTIIDATNPISDAPPEEGVLHYFSDINLSLMEELQDMAPEAHFVKAFSSVGSLHMVDPAFGIAPSMFICGNNAAAKNEVRHILTQFGWETEDMGGAKSARAIEPLAMLWCLPGFRENKWNHAFKVLKK